MRRHLIHLVNAGLLILVLGQAAGWLRFDWVKEWLLRIRRL